MKRKLLFSLMVMAITTVHFQCVRLPSGQTKNVDLTVTNFMKDCFSGDINGSSTDYVKYQAEIYVYEQNGSTNSLISSYYVLVAMVGGGSPTFTQTIKVSTDKTTKITIIIDGKECSKCSASCNSYTVNENGASYTISGKPYWKSDFLFAAGMVGTTLTLAPRFFPRDPNNPTCTTCKIKN